VKTIRVLREGLVHRAIRRAVGELVSMDDKMADWTVNHGVGELVDGSTITVITRPTAAPVQSGGCRGCRKKW